MSSITIAPPTLNWGQAYELRINPDPFDSPLEPLPGSADQPAARTRDTECDLYLGSIQGLFEEEDQPLAGAPHEAASKGVRFETPVKGSEARVSPEAGGDFPPPLTSNDGVAQRISPDHEAASSPARPVEVCTLVGGILKPLTDGAGPKAANLPFIDINATLVRNWGAQHPAEKPAFDLTADFVRYDVNKGAFDTETTVTFYKAKVSYPNTSRTVQDTGISRTARVRLPNSPIETRAPNTIRFTATQRGGGDSVIQTLFCDIPPEHTTFNLQFGLTSHGFALSHAPANAAEEPGCLTRTLGKVEAYLNPPPTMVHEKAE